MNPQDPYQPQTPQTNPQPPVTQPPPAMPQAPDPRHQKVSRELTVTQPGETTICTIKRHPIGIFGIYGMIGFMLIAIALLAFVVAPQIFTDVSSNQVRGYGVMVFFLVAVICLAYGLIATIVYWGNSWIVTSDSITQISQTSLFNRESSQLSLGNLEDITAEQNGILAQMFHYGVLRVETAGHHSKFFFLYCPNPNYYAKEVIAAREAHEQKLENVSELAAQRPQATDNQRGWHNTSP